MKKDRKMKLATLWSYLIRNLLRNKRTIISKLLNLKLFFTFLQLFSIKGEAEPRAGLTGRI